MTRSEPPPVSLRQQLRTSHRERARRELATARLDIDSTVLSYVFDRDGFYEGLADRLLEAIPLHRRIRRGHWLCTQLNDLATGTDPDAYARQIRKPTRDGLIALGCRPFIANVLGAGAGLGLKIALGNTPMGHLTTALRTLIALTCPNLSTCPTEKDVAKNFATPILAEQLRSLSG